MSRHIMKTNFKKLVLDDLDTSFIRSFENMNSTNVVEPWPACVAYSICSTASSVNADIRISMSSLFQNICVYCFGPSPIICNNASLKKLISLRSSWNQSKMRFSWLLTANIPNKSIVHFIKFNLSFSFLVGFN